MGFMNVMDFIAENKVNYCRNALTGGGIYTREGGLMSEKLMEEYRAEHLEIVAMLREAKELCVGSQGGPEKLLKAKEALFAHLDREVLELKPALMAAAETNDGLRESLEDYDKDMREVDEIARDFFDNYRNDCSDMRFIKDFGTLLIMLRDIFAKEENILFQEYEKLQS
jgi:hypothetical protein